MKHWHLILLICSIFFSVSCSDEKIPSDNIINSPSVVIYVSDKDGKDLLDPESEDGNTLTPYIYYPESSDPTRGYKLHPIQGTSGSLFPDTYFGIVSASISEIDRKKPEVKFIVELSETKKVTVRIAWKKSAGSKKYYDRKIDKIYVDDVLMYSDSELYPYIVLTYE